MVVSIRSLLGVHETVDVTISDDGTLVGFTALTRRAKQWIELNVSTEGWQWLGDTFYNDHRFAQELIEGMWGDGLIVEQ